MWLGHSASGPCDARSLTPRDITCHDMNYFSGKDFVVALRHMSHLQAAVSGDQESEGVRRSLLQTASILADRIFDHRNRVDQPIDRQARGLREEGSRYRRSPSCGETQSSLDAFVLPVGTNEWPPSRA